PLTKHAVAVLSQRKDIVESITINTDASDTDIYPLNGNKHWTRDNYGPIWIPKRGATLTLTMDNIAVYERPIRVYEGNDLQVKNGKIYINGKQTNKYTFRMDYYWMQGDNRHCSADSRYWGFVPEDHIVGKPILVWLSTDVDKPWFSGRHIRWNRLFRLVSNI
ncbi:S26 family signal peptidase, partial [bacterium]|nr:S26 family signal peptidase [bacterium]